MMPSMNRPRLRSEPRPQGSVLLKRCTKLSDSYRFAWAFRPSHGTHRFMSSMGRIVVLLLLAALAANMQCYARCIASSQIDVPACHASDSCHHPASDQSGHENHTRHSGCDHQQPELVRSQIRSAATALLSTPVSGISALGAVDSLTIGLNLVEFTPAIHRCSRPPLSVLRI